MSSLSKARKLIPYSTISELGIASFEVEQILDVTQSGVSRLRSKGCQLYVIEGITLAGLEAMLLSHQCPTFVSEALNRVILNFIGTPNVNGARDRLKKRNS